MVSISYVTISPRLCSWEFLIWHFDTNWGTQTKTPTDFLKFELVSVWCWCLSYFFWLQIRISPWQLSFHHLILLWDVPQLSLPIFQDSTANSTALWWSLFTSPASWICRIFIRWDVSLVHKGFLVDLLHSFLHFDSKLFLAMLIL